MQSANVGNLTLNTQAPQVGAPVSVLPKNGEIAPTAVIAPVEEVRYSETPSAIRQEPVVYENPKKQAQGKNSQDKNNQNQDGAVNPAATTQAAEQSESSNAETKQPVGQQAEQAQTEQEQAELQELKQRDQEVRNHEQAHMAQGGQHSGAVSYEYQTGPDGVRYAVGGEVPIDVSEVSDDPEATLEKMMQIQRAALAPADPSSQDRQVAAQAGQKAAQAINELSQLEREERAEQAAELKARQEQVQQEKSEAKAEQEKADQKEQQDESVSMAERFAEYNAKLRRINETLLEISAPKPANVGRLINAQI